ncbi:beta-1,4-glucuronyltransferase 1-like isoform X2 [Palaemon carinicauda]|uniref:beta-1,4-glucuronyltransferase 1-like isoform X2 n=1 Tax=Palaemon carinicauda TaxID=392227 RepID=UPI0035B6A281
MLKRPGVAMSRHTIVRKYVSSYRSKLWIVLIAINLLIMFVHLFFVFTNKDDQYKKQQRKQPPSQPKITLQNSLEGEEVGLEEKFGFLRTAQKELQEGTDTLKHGSRNLPGHVTQAFVHRGDDWDNLVSSWPVCLSTQASVDLLFWVGEHVKTWSGPVSVAVYVPDSDLYVAMKMIEMMLSCNAGVRKQVSFHLIYPARFPPKGVNIQDSRRLEFGCDQLEMYNEYLLSEMNGTLQSRVAMQHLLYPQNLLRNVARDSCKTDYVFTPDVDMILVPGIDHHIKSFLNRADTKQCTRCAFVIPTYEISTEALQNPVDKAELLWFLKNKMARRFHIKTFKPNQANSHLKLWERSGKEPKGKKDKQNQVPGDSLMMEANGTLKVLYDITTWQNFWEPVYMAPADVPRFDERFVGYGCTRSSQVYEMHVSGFRWRMLNDAFLCHRGFQDKRARHLWSQINRNFKLYQVLLGGKSK